MEAAAVSDPSHIAKGSRGPHVEKIQTALNRLDDAGLDVDGDYGKRTADAVLAFKQARNIVNTKHQTTADNIVGRMTMAALDQEILAKEGASKASFRIERVSGTPVAMGRPPAELQRAASLAIGQRPGLTGFTGNGVGGPPGLSLRLAPREFARLQVVDTGGSAFLICTNTRLKGGDCSDKISFLWDPALLVNNRLAPEPFGPLVNPKGTDQAFGGSLVLTNDPHFVNVDAFRVGDAIITGANAAGQQFSVHIQVRAPSAGPVPGRPLTKLEPGSKFFSASMKNGGEPEGHGVSSGRPVNPQRGGRMINIGGEMETPEFEDYQVSIAFSGYRREFINNGRFVFRPLTDDPAPGAHVADGSASHICIRGNPLTPDRHIPEIIRIASAGCLFTFSGAASDAKLAVARLPGTVLEDDNIADGQVVIRLKS